MSAKQQTWIITFNDVSPDTASRYASQLKAILLDSSPDIKVAQRSSSEYTQSLGDTLIAILNTAATVTGVKAITTWLQSRTGASINVETNIEKEDTKRSLKIEVKGITNRNCEKMLSQLIDAVREDTGKEK